MRIIIELNAQGGIETPIYEPSQPSHKEEAVDGGVPSETLIHAIEETLPSSTTVKEEMNGGSPPEGLVEAIQKEAQSHPDNTDAGSAPSEE